MSDNKLLQNNLAEATTENGFPTVTNTPLQKEVTLETGETVIVEGITPDKMKAVLNQNVDGNEGGVTFLTPGENYNEEIKGVCQTWNASIVIPDLVSIAITTAPTKTAYTAGETFDNTGMVVTATYSNTTTKAVTGYTVTPSGALATTDTSVTISYTEGGVTKTATQAITVTEPVAEDIVITSNKTVTVDFHSLALELEESLSTYMQDGVTNLACESYPIIEIKGKDTKSTIEFYISETLTKVLVKLGYKTGEDTGSSVQIASIDNQGSQPGYVMGNLEDVLEAVLGYSLNPVTIDVSSIGAGVSTFLKESTPLTVITVDSGEISNVTVDLKDFVTVS